MSFTKERLKEEIAAGTEALRAALAEDLAAAVYE